MIAKLEEIKKKLNASKTGKKLSMADHIVLAGAAGVEEAAKRGGHAVKVPFTPGRTVATQEMTDVESFAMLEPAADGFRNYLGRDASRPSPELRVHRANMLTLTAPEIAVLLGGLRVLGANHSGTKHGVITDRPGTLTNDFFVNLMDTDLVWQKSKTDANV